MKTRQHGNFSAATLATFRANSGQFQRNFTAGDSDKNGLLAAEDNEVDANNVKLVGRAAFVERIKRHSVPLPELPLTDRMQ